MSHTVICTYCTIPYIISEGDLARHKKLNRLTRFCSYSCSNNYSRKTIYCVNCNKSVTIKLSDPKKFCSKSCSAKYNNKHKTKGSRRSKLEVWVESKLTELYPNLIIDYNKIDSLEMELDIYVPSLKLAFELNGIFHYEPIFGDKKLQNIQRNDTNKFEKCQQLGISLCIIDVSKQKYFKEKTSIPFLDIILLIINQKLLEGF